MVTSKQPRFGTPNAPFCLCRYILKELRFNQFGAEQQETINIRGMPTERQHLAINMNGMLTEQQNLPVHDHGGPNLLTKFDRKNRDRTVFRFKVKVALFGLGMASCFLSWMFAKNHPKLKILEVDVWQWCLLITAFLGGAVVSQTLQTLIQLLTKCEFWWRENLIYYVVETIGSAKVVLWSGFILAAWVWSVQRTNYVHAEHKKLTPHDFAQTTHFVTQSLSTFLLGSLLWLIKDVVIMVGKSSFHIRRFFNRVRNTFLDQYIIMRLMDQSMESLPLRGDGMDVCPELIGEFIRQLFITIGLGKKKKSGVSLKDLKRVDAKTVSNWGMRILIHEIMEHNELAYKTTIGGQDKHINSEEDAQQAADLIFRALLEKPMGDTECSSSSSVSCDAKEEIAREEEIATEDILREYGHNDGSEIIKWANEGADNKPITWEIFCKRMVKAWKQRTTLVGALSNNEDLFQNLHICANVILLSVIILIWLAMVLADLSGVIAAAGTFIAGSVIFGEYWKQLLNNFTFVFYVHPFDTGDLCLIEGILVTIKEVHLHSTVVCTVDNQMKIYPNEKLANLPIVNYTRSPPDMDDNVMFYLPFGTSQKQIDQLKQRIKRYIEEHKDLSCEEYYLAMDMESTADKTTRIKATLRFKYNINIDDFRVKEYQKTQLIRKIQEILYSENE